MTNFQRVGAKSNAQIGKEFEKAVQVFFMEQHLHLESEISLEIGVSKEKKGHKWSLGCHKQKILVKCKAHTWTAGNNMPSAKLTTWDQAMFYMSLAPSDYRKIFVCLKHERTSNGETLGSYYIRQHGHLIPNDVEILEFDEEAGCAEVIKRPK